MPTEKELKELYDKLSKHIQNVLSSAETAKEVERIGKKHNMDVVDINMLLNEVGLVLLGVEDQTTFAKDIEEVFDMEHIDAKIIAEELTTSIFSKMDVLESGDVKEDQSTEDLSIIKQTIRDNKGSVSIKNLIAEIK